MCPRCLLRDPLERFIVPSWESELDLHPFRRHVLLYWAGTPIQDRQANCQYSLLPTNAVQREMYRCNGEWFLGRSYALVDRGHWLYLLHVSTLLVGFPFWFKAYNSVRDVLAWQDRYLHFYLQSLSRPLLRRSWPTKIALRPDLYTSADGAKCGSWPLQV